MKTLIGSAALLLSASAFAAAAPVVSDVAMKQEGSRLVTITYKLSEAPAIVTVDVQTNRGDGTFVSIGGKALRNVVGHVSEVIQPGTDTRKILWKPRKDWPEQTEDIRGDNVRAVVTAWATNMPPDYLVINLADANESLKYYPGEDFLPLGIESDFYRTNSLVMRKIPASGIKWRMGSSKSTRQVVLTEDYYMAIFEMTCGQCSTAGIGTGTWAGFTPWNSKLRPVFWELYSNLRGTSEDMSVISASSRLGVLRSTYNLAFDIPTSAQWEFACRAGCGEIHYDGTTDSTKATMNRLGRYTENSGHNGGSGAAASLAAEQTFDKFTARPGSYMPNAFGLYDMLGNVSEWCRDYRYTMTSDGIEFDPVGSDASKAAISDGVKARVARGGSWNSWGTELTSDKIFTATPQSTQEIYTSNPCGIGYRLVLPIPGR